MQSRRARKSLEQWTELVDQFDSSDHSMDQFCQQEHLAISTFQRWRSMIHKSREFGKNDTPSGFTCVNAPATPTTGSASVTVQIGSSITLTIHTPESI